MFADLQYWKSYVHVMYLRNTKHKPKMDEIALFSIHQMKRQESKFVVLKGL